MYVSFNKLSYVVTHSNHPNDWGHLLKEVETVRKTSHPIHLSNFSHVKLYSQDKTALSQSFGDKYDKLLDISFANLINRTIRAISSSPKPNPNAVRFHGVSFHWNIFIQLSH